MPDMLAQLHDASWRGILFPFTGQREYGFQHEQERHRFVFKDEQLIESLGRENPTYRYVCPFREDLARAPWVNLFSKVYPQFLQACLDRSNGILDDPIHGPVQCKVASMHEVLDVGKKDGIDVEVTFILSPDEDFNREEIGSELANLQTAQGYQDFFDREARKLDPATLAAIAALNKGSEKARVDPLTAATGALNQIEAMGNKAQAAVGDLAFKMNRFEESVGRLAHPNLTPIRMAARKLALAANDLSAQLLTGKGARPRPVRIYTVPSDSGVVALAAQLGMGLQEFLRLNPLAARQPKVTKGTQVSYYG
jgi:hypothetical protein